MTPGRKSLDASSISTRTATMFSYRATMPCLFVRIHNVLNFLSGGAPTGQITVDDSSERGKYALLIDGLRVQQTVPDSPDNHLLLRLGLEFPLDSIDGVSDGKGTLSPGFRNLGIGETLRE